jgi:hypothetical protein
MNTEFYKVKISPEVLKTIVQDVNYDGQTVGVYSGMSEMLSGGTLGTSLFTGLTIPILLTQNTVDLGYYSVFDGDILQLDVVNNFVIYSTGSGPYESYVIKVQNTSDKFISSNQLSQYTIDFGDGSPLQNFPMDGVITHTYPSTPRNYTIVVNQKGPWGIITIKKQINLPSSTSPIILDPFGDAYFEPIGGSWSSSPISYRYLFTGDTTNQIRQQISKPYVNPYPFVVSGATSSRLTELKSYGIPNYKIGPVIKNGGVYGTITQINSFDGELGLFYTAYTIGDVNYIDYQNNTTIYALPSSGFTEDSFATNENDPIQIIIEPNITLPNGDFGCSTCGTFDAVIEVIDLLNATNNTINPENNNKVFITYSSCYDSGFVIKTYDTPGRFIDDFCVRNSGTDSVVVYYYRNDVLVEYYKDYENPDVLSRAINTNTCCQEVRMAQPIVKDEMLLGISSEPQIQSNVYIERGKQAPYERIQRLGEINNLGQLNRYGYGYFKL